MRAGERSRRQSVQTLPTCVVVRYASIGESVGRQLALSARTGGTTTAFSTQPTLQPIFPAGRPILAAYLHLGACDGRLCSVSLTLVGLCPRGAGRRARGGLTPGDLRESGRFARQKEEPQCLGRGTHIVLGTTPFPATGSSSRWDAATSGRCGWLPRPAEWRWR